MNELTHWRLAFMLLICVDTAITVLGITLTLEGLFTLSQWTALTGMSLWVAGIAATRLTIIYRKRGVL